MKFGVLGDLHFTNRGPQRRLDDYFCTQVSKFNQSLDIFEKNNCDYIIQVGDFFESPDVSNYVISTIISLLRDRKLKVFCCYGQHDISGHNSSTLKRSPLKVLESADVVKILSSDFYCVGLLKDDPTYLYAASFGEEIPLAGVSDSYNILVTHRMIGDRPLYPDQELDSPRKFLKDNPSFDLILCGDYHYRFSDTYNSRTIINPGCLMRKTISKFDLEHKPGVAVFDTIENKLDFHLLDIRPIKEVFNLEKEEKRDNKELLQFIESLRDNNESEVDWKKNLLKVLCERKSSQDVKNLIEEAIVKVKGEN